MVENSVVMAYEANEAYLSYCEKATTDFVRDIEQYRESVEFHNLLGYNVMSLIKHDPEIVLKASDIAELASEIIYASDEYQAYMVQCEDFGISYAEAKDFV